MQEKGYYNIVIQIKYFYVNDIAIEVCRQLVKERTCESFVKVYVAPHSKNAAINTSTPTLESIIFYPDNYDIYNGKER